MRSRIVTVTVLFAVSLAAYAAVPTPPIGQAAAVSACARAGDRGNLCQWNGSTCALDVEKMDKAHPCDFSKSTTDDMDSDHKPMCFSVTQKHHIVFSSSAGRTFRVRRLVPITATNAHGDPCPPHPFGHHFDPGQIQFNGGVDSQTPSAAAIGCKYKLEVQFSNQDPGAPAESDGHRYECRDPHLKITN